MSVSYGSSDQSVLAIDIGGTKIAIAAVTADGTISHQTQVPTLRGTDGDATFAPLGEGLAKIISEAGLTGPLRVGIGSAGPIDSPGGWISPVNIGAWREYPIVAKVAEAVRDAAGSPPTVGLAQDGHCMALGEHWLGAGKDLHSMVGMVLSTGVGAGAVINDRLFGGLTGNAVLLGNISVNAWGDECVCGGQDRKSVV